MWILKGDITRGFNNIVAFDELIAICVKIEVTDIFNDHYAEISNVCKWLSTSIY